MNHTSNTTFALGALCGLFAIVAYLAHYKDLAAMLAVVCVLALAGSLVMFIIGERRNPPPK